MHSYYWDMYFIFTISIQWYLHVGWLGEMTGVFIGSVIGSSSIWAWEGTYSAIHKRKIITTCHQLYIWHHIKYFYFIAYIPHWIDYSPPTWGSSPRSCGTCLAPLQSFFLFSRWEKQKRWGQSYWISTTWWWGDASWWRWAT